MCSDERISELGSSRASDQESYNPSQIGIARIIHEIAKAMATIRNSANP